jgi:diguanylate cyclase (GGDEF)-like protein
MRRAWWIFAVSFFILGTLAVVRLLNAPRVTDAPIVTLIGVVGFAAVRHRQAVTALEVGRREEAESFARILSSLSRSVSPDAILGAIVAELASATGADHIVIARRRPDARVLEATLVSARPGVADSTTFLPIRDLEEPIAVAGPLLPEPVATPVLAGSLEPAGTNGPRSWIERLPTRLAASIALVTPAPSPVARRAPSVPGGVLGERDLVAERVAARAREMFGVSNTLTAPLTSNGVVIGAIVLSRRTADAWPAPTRRLLSGAAIEASGALSRAYSHRAAVEQASTDALTGLPNRRYFDEFTGLLAQRRRSGDAVGVLMIDIDKFKDLNDTHGHATGDEVLRAVGGAIVAAVREDDVPARYGGEEFVVLLRNPTPEEALDVGERVRASVAALELGPLGVAGVSVSVGVAVARDADQSIEELVKGADRALYRAKRAGRDRVIAA